MIKKKGDECVHPHHRRAYYFPPPNNYVPYFYPPHYQYQRVYPQVDPTLFITSAKHMQIIMKDASILLDRMASSRQFAFDLMTAAQNSEQAKVNQMLKNTGIQTTPKISFNPDGLILNFSSVAEDLDCCHLTLSLRWRK